MPKLYFKYGTMNSGKSSSLLQANFNYIERGMNTILFIPTILDKQEITSRIGIHEQAKTFSETFSFYEYISVLYERPFCIFVDEAQFLKKDQVWELCHIVDDFKIPVMCFGLRNDFLGEPFEGSMYLLTLADDISEIKSICYCGKKTTMNLRKDVNGVPIRIGTQTDIGGNEKYTSLCRKCFIELSILKN